MLSPPSILFAYLIRLECLRARLRSIVRASPSHLKRVRDRVTSLPNARRSRLGVTHPFEVDDFAAAARLRTTNPEVAVGGTTERTT